MKKMVYLLIFLAMSCSSMLAFANDVCVRTLATVNCGKGVLDNLSEGGFVNIDGTTVKNNTQVEGVFSIKNADLNNVNLSGTGTITDTGVRGDFVGEGAVSVANIQFTSVFKFKGSMSANATTFLNLVELTIEKATFKNSGVKSILVHKTGHSNEIIYLEDHTVVNGDVTFESGNGIVMESSGSSVTGVVSGGKIIHL